MKFHLDEPAPSAGWSRCLFLRGWIFATNGSPVTGLRLTAGSVTLSGVIALPRPDVKAALPEAPGANTGFEVRGMLPAGTHDARLSARLADGRWVELVTRRISIPRRFFPLWLSRDWRELLCTQMPTQMVHAPRAVSLDKFPAVGPAETRPRLAIVTPSYQQAQFLGETMRSVLGQLGVSCDYLVQDGGSTDGSVDLIRRHASSLAGWSSAPDAGQADAIARGFARTSGAPEDLMAWLNSDDFYQPGALAFVADYFARHPAVDVLYGHRVLVDENSREIGRWFLPPHDDGILRLNDFVPQETLFWRRRIWDRAGGIDPSFQFAMDWDLLLRFQAAGARIVRVPYFLACFRVHAAQKTSGQMHQVGQREIDRLRERTFGRAISPAELERDPRLLRYLRHSAWMEFLWKLGLRAL